MSLRTEEQQGVRLTSSCPGQKAEEDTAGMGKLLDTQRFYSSRPTSQSPSCCSHSRMKWVWHILCKQESCLCVSQAAKVDAP